MYNKNNIYILYLEAFFVGLYTVNLSFIILYIFTSFNINNIYLLLFIIGFFTPLKI
jgi:hypothetical protein